MSIIPVVQNPRSRRRRRKTKTLTAAQKRAGFGGKSLMARKRRKTTRRRRRPNPTMAALTNPRRRRRSPAKRRYARRRNPGLGGMFGFGKFLDLQHAIGVTAGFAVNRMAPTMVAKVWASAPTSGIGGVAVRVGASFGVAYLTNMFFKSRSLAVSIVTGSVAAELYQVVSDQLLPALGLSGLPYNDLSRMGIYRRGSAQMGRPVGLYRNQRFTRQTRSANVDPSLTL